MCCYHAIRLGNHTRHIPLHRHSQIQRCVCRNTRSHDPLTLHWLWLVVCHAVVCSSLRWNGICGMVIMYSNIRGTRGGRRDAKETVYEIAECADEPLDFDQSQAKGLVRRHRARRWGKENYITRFFSSCCCRVSPSPLPKSIEVFSFMVA